MNVGQIIVTMLKKHNYDGLFNPDHQCACEIGDLSPGDCINFGCEAGFKKTHSVTGEWIIHKRQGHVSDDDIQSIIDGLG
jgi:hypothetical protein